MSEKMKQIIAGVSILAIVIVLTLVMNNDSDSSESQTIDASSEVLEDTESGVEESEVSEDAASTEEEQESSGTEDLEDPVLTDEEDTEEETTSVTTTAVSDSTTTAAPGTTAAPATTQAPLVEGAWEYNVSSPECDWMGTGGCGFYHRASEPEFPYVGPPGSSGVMNSQQWGTQGEWAYNLNDGTCSWNGDGCGFFFGNTYDTYNLGSMITVPNAPTNVLAGQLVGEMWVIWDAPSSTGGVSILGYEVTSSTGHTCNTVGRGPIVLEFEPIDEVCRMGFIGEGTHSFTVVAINALGSGPSSTASPSVATVSHPGAPRNLEGFSENDQAKVTWWAPIDDCCTPITGFTVTASPGGATCTAPPGSTGECTVTGLTNGVSYTLTVVANGDSWVSDAASVVVVPGTPSVPEL